MKNIKRFLCFIFFNHLLTQQGFEDGKAREYRHVTTCNCGKRVVKGHWTDDNQELGHKGS